MIRVSLLRNPYRIYRTLKADMNTCMNNNFSNTITSLQVQYLEFQDFIYMSKPPWFKVGEQQDASEYLRYMLNQIEQEEKQINKPVVRSNFYGKLQRMFRCKTCKKVTDKQENFLDLPILFEEDGMRSGTMIVQEMVRNFFRSTMFTKENQLNCAHCASLRDYECSLEILPGDAPEYLIITFNRFSYNSLRKGVDKNMTKTDIPEKLKLPFTGGEEVYTLVAVVFHQGYSGDTGHYYTVARGPASKQQEHRWYRLDDNSVVETAQPGTSSTRQTAHMIFYEKQIMNLINI